MDKDFPARPPLSRQAPKALATTVLLGALAAPFVHSACMTDPEPPIDPEPEPEVAELVVLSGDQQIQGREARLNDPVVVLARDESGRPVRGARVGFTPEQGHGSAEPSEVHTDSRGVAAARWTLGNVVGPQAMAVSARGATDVAVAATARRSDFDIHVVADSGFTPTQTAIIRDAAERWTAVIVGDKPDVDFPASHRSANCPIELGEAVTIDDMRWHVRISQGSNPTIVYGYCEIRRSEEGRAEPLWFHLDISASLVGRVFVNEVWARTWIGHQLGHLLGVGMYWGELVQHLEDGRHPHFPDTATVAAFDAAGGVDWNNGPKVPVERSMLRHRDLDWRYDVFGAELMSGLFARTIPVGGGPYPTTVPPLSAITVLSLVPIGYEVDVSMADPYVLPAPGAPVDSDVMAGHSETEPGHGPAVEVVYDQGRVVRVVVRYGETPSATGKH